MRRIGCLVAGVVLTGPLVACGGGDDGGGPAAGSGGFPMTVLSCSDRVTFDRRPETVITAGVDSATLMWAAGAADQIDIRTAESGYPLGRAERDLSGIRQLSIGDEPSKEAIIGTGADLVMQYGLNMTSVADLAEVGITSLIPTGRCDQNTSPNPDGDVDFDDVYADIEAYARLFGTGDVAARNVADLRARVAAVAERVRDIPENTAAALYFPADGSPLGAYGNQSMSHTQIEALGLRDVFGDVPARTFVTNVEELITRNPDIVIVLVGNGIRETPQRAVERIRDLPGAAGVTAVRTGDIVPLRYTYLGAGPLTVDGLEMMADRILR